MQFFRHLFKGKKKIIFFFPGLFAHTAFSVALQKIFLVFVTDK